MESAASIDYVDVSPGEVAGDSVGAVAPSATSPVPRDEAAVLFLVSADIHAVILGLRTSDLRCVVVCALAPVIGAAGPLAIDTALVIQIVDATISISGTLSLWRRHGRGYYVYALIAALTCLCAVAALLTPAGSQPAPISATMDPTVTPLPSPPSCTHRVMAFVRHWLSTATDPGMLIVTVSGVLLPHQGEILRALGPTVSTRNAGSGQGSLPQAIETIKDARPDEPVLSARWDTDVVKVRTKQATYTVSPTTGHETSRASVTPVWVSTLGNLHRCLLSCRGPSHVGWIPQGIPHTGWRYGHRELTVGGLVVAILEVVLAVLIVSGLRTWWPLRRHRRAALSAYRRTQRLSRDADLPRTTGLVLLPLLFLWGYYASAFSIHPTQPAAPVSITARQSPTGSTSTGPAQDIGPHRTVAATQEAGDGQAVVLFLSQPSDPSSTCTVWVVHRERLTPGQFPDDVMVSIAVNIGPGTERTAPPSTPGRRPTTRANQRL